MFKNYLSIAIRHLKRNKIFSVINIFGLSIGLACSMLIILYVKDEVSFDRFHINVSNIYRIAAEATMNGETRKDGNTGYFQGPRFTAGVPELKAFVRVNNIWQDIKQGTEIRSTQFLQADSSFFDVFSFPLLSGSAKHCLKDPYSIVMTEEAAMKEFGSTDVIGKTIQVRLDEKFEPYTVTAVAKNPPQNSSIRFNYVLPFVTTPDVYSNSENWFNFFLNTFVVVTPGADISAVEKKINTVYSNESREGLNLIIAKFGPVNFNSKYILQPYTDMHLSTELPAQNGLENASNPMYSYILTGIAVFILLIACINFINLTIARSVKRAKEIGIRKVIGGQRKQLIIQFLGESFILASLAFVLAVVLVQLCLPVFNDLSNKALSITYLFDVKLVLSYVALLLCTGLLAGFYPALVLSGYNPVQTLYSRFSIGGKNYLQKSLVVVQFALASFLIIATLVLYAQFNFLTGKKLGYDDSNLVMVNKYKMTTAESRLFRNELLKNAGIESMAAKNAGGWSTAAKVNRDSTLQFAYETVDPAYIEMLKIPVVTGRNFSPQFASDSTDAVIVNESFVKKAGWKNPVGQLVDFWYNNKKYNVIGVVKDYHYKSLNEEIGPQLFIMKPDNLFGTAYIKLKPASASAALKHIEKTFKQLFPLSPYSYQFLDQQNRNQYNSERKWKEIMLFSAIITIFISCIGLFGLSVLAAEKRVKEIGIRKVLGASVNNIVSILSKDFVKLVMLALIISIPAAWWGAQQWLQHYPYKITLGWSVFGLASVMVLTIALATVSFQAIKAAMANPVKSLRTE